MAAPNLLRVRELPSEGIDRMKKSDALLLLLYWLAA